MNYGLSQMEKGNYQVALKYFQKTEKLLPYWAYTHINLAILKGAMGHPTEAEASFQRAIQVQPDVVESYYYYAKWLRGQNRIPDAVKQLQIGKAKSPGHANINQLLSGLINKDTKEPIDQLKLLEENVEKNPTPDNLLNLSLSYYKNGQYKKCIEACEKAIKGRPDFALAYNNICSAYNALGELDKALIACKKAVELAPDYNRAKNNLKLVSDNIAKDKAESR